MSNATPEELAAAAREPGTFSFIERLRGRNYAKDTVTVYLNEELGYKLQEVEAKIEDGPSVDELAALEKELAALRAELAPDKYIFHVEGISNEDYDKLVADAVEQFPYEYEDSVDLYTGKKTKETVDSPERNEYFTNLLWSKVIRKVELADGDSDENINSGWIETFRRLGPINALQHVGLAVEKVRMGSEWIEYAEDEDFLVKP
jgi:hypothetical protein